MSPSRIITLAEVVFLAIGVCFSMTDIFRSDILAVVMNQLVDEPVLPTLFLRTVSPFKPIHPVVYLD